MLRLDLDIITFNDGDDDYVVKGNEKRRYILLGDIVYYKGLLETITEDSAEGNNAQISQERSEFAKV